MIDLVEVSQLVNLSKLLEQLGQNIQEYAEERAHPEALQTVDLQESYIALIDMAMIWRMAAPSAEDRQTQDGTPNKWLDYIHKVSSITLNHQGDANHIICVNDRCDAAQLKMTSKTCGYRVMHVPDTCSLLSQQIYLHQGQLKRKRGR